MNKTICAGIGALALIGGLAACGSASSGSASSGSGNSPYAQGVAFAGNGDSASIIGTSVLDTWLTANDPYGMSTQNGEQWALGAEVGYEQHALPGQPTATSGVTIASAVVSPSTLTVNNGIVFQAVLTFSDGSSETTTVTDRLTGWVNGSDGYSWTTTVTDPNGIACATLDSAGYCPGDDPGSQANPTPATTQAAAPPPTPSAAAPTPVATPTVTRVLPVFACGIGPTAGGSVGPTSGYGSGYTSAVVKVTVLNSQGNAIQTLTLTLTSTETEANGGTPWSEVIDPNGEPRAASCTVTVESASLIGHGRPNATGRCGESTRTSNS
jgi:hypothetical protein